MKSQTPLPPDELHGRATRLGLHGLLSRWADLGREAWVQKLVDIEETERQRRSLERRIQNAQIGPFKPMADFDWAWPKKIDRELIEDLLGLQFIRDRANIVFFGPNSSGKTKVGTRDSCERSS